MTNKRKLLLCISVLTTLFYPTQQVIGQSSVSWPAITPEMKPGSRWWWMGNAVDKGNLQYNLEEYSRKGLGLVEITPIYGLQNNEQNEIPFLSKKWMDMYSFAQSINNRVGILTDMNTGTGWPFGGPEVTIEDAASKLLIRKYIAKGQKLIVEKITPNEKDQQQVAKLQVVMAFDGKKIKDLSTFVAADGTLSWQAPQGNWTIIAAFCGKTFQKVKRAAPGGEGWVMDHFSKRAVANYLMRFEKAFDTTGSSYPHSFFNDSYEVYKADWTSDFFEQFAKRRGYKLEEHLPEFLAEERTPDGCRIISDYRETLGELLQENFSSQWTNWAHLHGSKTRNQAHGSPGNLIDIYATVDIPECEGFGLSNFGIQGLRTDSLTRKNFSDLSMLKYASSAAHIAGKPYTSSETFTWLTEHFRTSLSQCKPDLDLMFVAGINHMNFHGTTYSPREANWPGWKFYASIDMSPTNSIWHDAQGLMKYITRCQSFLQTAKSDNDFLVYLPVYDAWNDQKGNLLLFDIHSMDKKMPEFIKTVTAIYENGYDLDYVSDQFILSAKCINKHIITSGGAEYKALILPAVKRIPHNVMAHLNALIGQGATVVFLDNYPQDVPGFYNHDKRIKELNKILKKTTNTQDFTQTHVFAYKNGRVITGTDYKQTLDAVGVQAEEMITQYGLHAIRQKNTDGYQYFISCLQNKPVDEWIELAVPFKLAVFFNPLNGDTGKASIKVSDGKSRIHIQLKSGESIILKTFNTDDVAVSEWEYRGEKTAVIPFCNDWTLRFENSEPQVKSIYTLKELKSWTELPNDTLKINAGTGIYENSFNLNESELKKDLFINLGDVRESAHLYINEQDAGILWSVPFECRINNYVKVGKNNIRIAVTNLPANRISDLDRKKVKWRNFKEINMVDRNYQETSYSNWKPMESGLCSPVQIELSSRH